LLTMLLLLGIAVIVGIYLFYPGFFTGHR
jgi:hypothetical protein